MKNGWKLPPLPVIPTQIDPSTLENPIIYTLAPAENIHGGLVTEGYNILALDGILTVNNWEKTAYYQDTPENRATLIEEMEKTDWMGLYFSKE